MKLNKMYPKNKKFISTEMKMAGPG